MAISNINSLSLAGAGAPGLSLVATATASAAASVSINNCFTSAYDNYLVTVVISMSSVTNHGIRMRVGGTDSTAASYQQQGLYSGSTTVSGGRSTNQTSWQIFNNDTTDEYAATVHIFGPQTATTTKGTSAQERNGATTSIAFYNTTFGFAATTQFDGFTIFPGSGTITTPTDGIRVYGLKN
jgi:hypothetical protein